TFPELTPWVRLLTPPLHRTPSACPAELRTRRRPRVADDHVPDERPERLRDRRLALLEPLGARQATRASEGDRSDRARPAATRPRGRGRQPRKDGEPS